MGGWVTVASGGVHVHLLLTPPGVAADAKLCESNARWNSASGQRTFNIDFAPLRLRWPYTHVYIRITRPWALTVFWCRSQLRFAFAQKWAGTIFGLCVHGFWFFFSFVSDVRHSFAHVDIYIPTFNLCLCVWKYHVYRYRIYITALSLVSHSTTTAFSMLATKHRLERPAARRGRGTSHMDIYIDRPPERTGFLFKMAEKIW